MKRKKIVKFAAWGIVAALVAWGVSAIAVYWVSAGRVFDKPSDVPHCRAAVVLGCRKALPNGLLNLYFTRRIAAAAELYKAGKVDCLIVSGNNHIKEYDEASDMKESLAEAGVPADRVICDYAGFRTLDSVVRAKKVFGLDSFIVVSQKDHVRRAVFTARGFGCNAYGYAAPDVNGRYSIKTTIREQLAKIAAVLDVILRRGPKFLGPRELLPTPLNAGKAGDANGAATVSTGVTTPATWRQADFASELYRHVAEQAEEDNIVLSPWGVANLFALLQTGAQGDTARGMASALQLGDTDSPSPDEVAATFKAARDNLELISRAADETVAIELSDSLWLKHGFELSPNFAVRAQKAFAAEVRTTQMGARGRKAINSFVFEKTHGRIKDLLQPPLLDNPLTRFVAVDTVYFNAKWQDAFERVATRNQVFHAPSGDVEVPFLHATRSAVILDAPECAALRLPYRFGSVEMLLILPSPTNTLTEVEAKLSEAWLCRLNANPWRGEAEIALPKFDFCSRHDLKKSLKQMGMGLAFSEGADFGRIANGRGEFYVAEAIQNANITVDEKGTEAAAVTYAECTEGLIDLEDIPPRPFIADRPFLFLIRETRTGLILFIGRVTRF